MSKKQTGVLHSSTESEIISLDTGLRIDGFSALELWDLIVSVFGSVSQISDRTGRPDIPDRSEKSQGKINVLNNIDCVPSNILSSHQEALLYVFAVIKMIIKGRSPTMRHVSRTHRVALDWLFDRINLDAKIQIEYIDTKNQLRHSTKGSFTRDEWNHLLCLFNISHSVLQFVLKQCKKISTRFRRRTSHSKIATNDEPHCKGAIERIILDFSKPGEEKVWKSGSFAYECWKEERASDYYLEQFIKKFLLSKLLNWDDNHAWSSQEWKTDTEMCETIGEIWCNFLGNDTRIPTWILSGGNSAWWNRAIRCEWGNTSWKIGETRCWSSKRSKATTIYHWKRWNRIRIVSGIKIIVNRVNDQVRKRQEVPMLQAMENNILLFGECLWLQRWNQRHSWERISQTNR